MPVAAMPPPRAAPAVPRVPEAPPPAPEWAPRPPDVPRQPRVAWDKPGDLELAKYLLVDLKPDLLRDLENVEFVNPLPGGPLNGLAHPGEHLVRLSDRVRDVRVVHRHSLLLSRPPACRLSQRAAQPHSHPAVTLPSRRRQLGVTRPRNGPCWSVGQCRVRPVPLRRTAFVVAHGRHEPPWSSRT